MQFDISQLYESKLASHIADLKQKVEASANVRLITSNPDFVLIDTTDMVLDAQFFAPIAHFDTTTIEWLEQAYKAFIGKCSLNHVVGYLSVKASLRPDRRLQIAHEGSLMKATYIHLQTREWILNPKGLKYYAASLQLNEADRAALQTVATHSITTVQSLPQAAVDAVFAIDNGLEAAQAWNVMLRS
jgi:hypothetical protein